MAGSLAAAGGPWPIPSRPPLETAAGRTSLDLVRAAAAAVESEAASRGPLEAGFGRREIEAPAGGPGGAVLAGYSVRTRTPAEAVHDPCFARAIALREGPGGPPALIMGADLLYVGALVRERVLAALAREDGIAAGRVFFTATHTHSAPGNTASSLAESIAVGRLREEVAGPLAAALAGAAHDALRDLGPAEVEVRRSSEPRYVRNRYWRASERVAPVDADLTVARFRAPGAEGRLRGVFAVYGAHATVVGPGRPLVSADWPGAFERTFEDRAAGVVALYAAGPVGSQAPRVPAGEGDEFARAERMGRALAGAAAAGAREAGDRFEGRPGMGLTTVEVPLPPLSFRLAPDWRASPLLAGALYPTPERAPISILRIGRDLFLGFPAEISGEVSLRMKEAAAARGLRLTVTSFAGGYEGYVPPDDVYGRWRYENRLSLHGPHFAAFLSALAEAACR